MHEAPVGRVSVNGVSPSPLPGTTVADPALVPRALATSTQRSGTATIAAATERPVHARFCDACIRVLSSAVRCSAGTLPASVVRGMTPG